MFVVNVMFKNGGGDSKTLIKVLTTWIVQVQCEVEARTSPNFIVRLCKTSFLIDLHQQRYGGKIVPKSIFGYTEKRNRLWHKEN
jgi:hypothetical protein